MSTARCYLNPVKNRSNLRIETNAHVQRLLIDGKKCTGIHYKKNGQDIAANADKEVIVCTGGVASPQLLELSGIGQTQLLKDHGIEVKHELSGVGEHLRDHINARIQFNMKRGELSYNQRMQGAGPVWQVMKYIFQRRGFMTLPSAPMLALSLIHISAPTRLGMLW